MVYTLGQAAKATGKTKAAISKAIKSGRLTGNKNDLGHFEIDPAELHRVYPPVNENSIPKVKGEREETPSELIELRLKVKMLEEQKNDLRAERDDLKGQRDEWQKQANMLALAHQNNETQDKKPQNIGWFDRLLGRGG